MASVDKEIIDLFTEVTTMQGLSALAGRVYAIVLLEPDPVSMDEIAERTGYSLASISTQLKLLEASGLVRRVKKPGSRKVYLTAEQDMLGMWKRQMRRALEGKFRIFKERYPSIIKKHKGKADPRVMARIENHYKHTQQFEKILRRIIDELA